LPFENVSNYIEEKFQVKVKDVLIRPLGHAISAHVYVILDRNMPHANYNKNTKFNCLNIQNSRDHSDTRSVLKK